VNNPKRRGRGWRRRRKTGKFEEIEKRRRRPSAADLGRRNSRGILLKGGGERRV
jgi:hypothetical protein